MTHCVDTDDSSFRTVLPPQLRRLADVCAVCGKGLVASWERDAHRACICPECLSWLYRRASGVPQH